LPEFKSMPPGILTTVTAENAPKAIGPYSQAVIADGTIYVAGQISLDPRTNEVVGRTTAEQTDQVLRNLTAVLKAAGSSLQLVVKTTVYLIDLADFPAMNEVYARHFGSHKPARSTLQAVALPKGVRIEIDAIARVF
jgi:2-iminobutanoate/2-iminopropanoate deaminase